MNRTIKEATVKRFHYETHDELRAHLAAPKPREPTNVQSKSDPPKSTPQSDRARQAAEQANPFLRNEGDTSRIAGMSKDQLKADTERDSRRTVEQDRRNRDASKEQGRRRDDDRDRSR